MGTEVQQSTPPAAGIYGQQYIDYKAYYTKVAAMVEEYNRIKDFDFIARTMERGTELKVRHWQRSMEMTRIPEYWVADRQKLSYFSIDVPLLNFAVGIGMSREAWQDATLKEADQMMAEAIRADERLQTKFIYHILHANAADANGATGASGLWNSTTSGLTPPPFKQKSFAATHNHYVGAGAGITEPTLPTLNAMKEHITEHGYSEDGNGLMLIFNSNMVKLFQNLAAFTTSMTPNPVVGSISTSGLKTGLSIHGFECFTDNWMTDNYLLGMSTQVPLVFQRIPQNPAGQGLQFYKGNNSDNPLLGSYFERRAGNVVREKGAGVIYELNVAAASYAAPTYTFDYTAAT